MQQISHFQFYSAAFCGYTYYKNERFRSFPGLGSSQSSEIRYTTPSIMKKRIFVGIAAPSVLAGIFNEYALLYKQHPRIRLVDRSKYHLTLCYIGEIPEEILSNVIATVQFICDRHKSFHIRFNRFALAPALRDARMIWAKFYVEPQFSALSQDLCQIFEYLQIPHKAHDHPIPHVTLARFPEAKGPKLLHHNPNVNNLEINEVYVWESRVSGEEREYVPLSIIPLK